MRVLMRVLMSPDRYHDAMNSPTIHKPPGGCHARRTAPVPFVAGQPDVSREHLITRADGVEPVDRFRQASMLPFASTSVGELAPDPSPRSVGCCRSLASSPLSRCRS